MASSARNDSGSDGGKDDDCVRCTPSYQFWPPSEVGQSKSSEDRVLNNTIVCTTRERDASSRGDPIGDKNLEILADSEEEMYETDMLVSRARTAVAHVRNLLHNVLPNSARGTAIHVEDHLTPVDLRCIEKIYGNMGEEMVELVRENPARALPLVLRRLVQKEKDWSMLRSEITKEFKEKLARHNGRLG